MNCPYCHHELPDSPIPSPVVVTGSTVADIREEWLDGTEPITVIYIEQKEDDYANEHIDRPDRQETAEVPARRYSLPELQKDVQADRRPQMPVLPQKTR